MLHCLGWTMFVGDWIRGWKWGRCTRHGQVGLLTFLVKLAAATSPLPSWHSVLIVNLCWKHLAADCSYNVVAVALACYCCIFHDFVFCLNSKSQLQLHSVLVFQAPDNDLSHSVHCDSVWLCWHNFHVVLSPAVCCCLMTADSCPHTCLCCQTV